MERNLKNQRRQSREGDIHESRKKEKGDPAAAISDPAGRNGWIYRREVREKKKRGGGVGGGGGGVGVKFLSK